MQKSIRPSDIILCKFSLKISYYDDLNEIINLALSDETLEGKKLILNGKDSVSYLDINNMIRQSKFHHDEPLYLYKHKLRHLHRSLQLFFQGNNHFINMVYNTVS
jgi:hypothetical protein